MFTRLLTKTADIQKVDSTQDLTGETTPTWSTVASYPCRYEKNSAPRVFDENYKVTLRDFIFFFDEGVVVANEDRILVDGKYFEVIASFNVEGMLRPHVEVYARFNDTQEASPEIEAYIPVPPTVTTLGPASFNSNSIDARVQVVDEGEYVIEELGIVWEQGGGEAKPADDTLPSNSAYQNQESTVGAFPPGSYTFPMTGLNDDTSYSYRAWVRSGEKYWYSEVEVTQATTQSQGGGGSGGGGAI